MKETSMERPQQMIVTRGLKEWYLTVCWNIREVEADTAQAAQAMDESDTVTESTVYEYECVTVRLEHLPTVEDAVQAVTACIDANTDEKIRDGFVWEGKSVKLNEENKFNFKAAYDLAVQTQGAVLPMKFKLGESEGVPVYHVFTGMEEFTDFYTKAIAFINQTLNEGWEEKDGAVQELNGSIAAATS